MKQITAKNIMSYFEIHSSGWNLSCHCEQIFLLVSLFGPLFSIHPHHIWQKKKTVHKIKGKTVTKDVHKTKNRQPWTCLMSCINKAPNTPNIGPLKKKHGTYLAVWLAGAHMRAHTHAHTHSHTPCLCSEACLAKTWPGWSELPALGKGHCPQFAQSSLIFT